MLLLGTGWIIAIIITVVIGIVVLAPWAFAGFESVSQSAAGFKFSPKKTIWIFLAALVIGAAAYILLTLIAAAIFKSKNYLRTYKKLRKGAIAGLIVRGILILLLALLVVIAAI